MGFMAKNQTLSFTPEPIFLPDLRKVTKSAPHVAAWCQVRCLKFITTKRPRKTLSRTSLSCWIVAVVKRAYQKFGRTLPFARAHDTRAISSSWALYKDVPVEEIVAIVGWQTPRSFQTTYPRDVLIGGGGEFPSTFADMLTSV